MDDLPEGGRLNQAQEEKFIRLLTQLPDNSPLEIGERVMVRVNCHDGSILLDPARVLIPWEERLERVGVVYRDGFLVFVERKAVVRSM